MHDWQNFYMLTGGAAATLTGLLFVAISLGRYLTMQQTTNALRTFVTPILLSYVQVLLVSCFAVMPLQNFFILGSVPVVLGAINILLALKVCWRMLVLHRDDEIDLGHWIWHFLLPLIAGLLFISTSLSFFWDGPLAALALSIAVLLCLMIGLRNTWVLTIWLLLHRKQEDSNIDQAEQTSTPETASHAG